jgi:hypothetical protein
VVRAHVLIEFRGLSSHHAYTLFLHALTMASKDGISRRDDDGKLHIASL